MRFISVGLAAFLLLGCASTGERVFIDGGHSTLMESREQNEPSVGQTSSISPGDPILASFDITVRPAIVLRQELKHDGKYNGFVNSYKITPGVLPLVGRNGKGRFFGADGKVRQKVPASNTDTFVRGGIFIPDRADEQHAIFIDNYSTAIEPITFKPDYDFTELTSIEDGDFRQELVFTGRVGTVINLEYREFSGGLARPAFSQTVTFDIANDKVIGFKGAMFEVINVSNSSLEYRVLKHFR